MNKNEKIKKLLDNSVLFTAEQKEAWLGLLPKMNDEELSELYSILADEVRELKKEGISLIDDPKLEQELIGAPIAADHGASIEALKAAAQAQSGVKPSSANEFAQELKREVRTLELEASPEELASRAQVVTKPAPLPEEPEIEIPVAPQNPELEVVEEAPSIGLNTLLEIKSVDDLQKIQTQHLRQGELGEQINLIKSKIVSLSHTNKILPFYAVEAFEQSPLYKTYMIIGFAMIGDPNPNRAQAFEAAVIKSGQETLTIREFEAVADLKKQIEQL